MAAVSLTWLAPCSIDLVVRMSAKRGRFDGYVGAMKKCRKPFTVAKSEGPIQRVSDSCELCLHLGTLGWLCEWGRHTLDGEGGRFSGKLEYSWRQDDTLSSGYRSQVQMAKIGASRRDAILWRIHIDRVCAVHRIFKITIAFCAEECFERKLFVIVRILMTTLVQFVDLHRIL